MNTSVKIIVDKPVNIWSPHHTGWEEHRTAYTQLVASLLVANHAFEVVQMRAFAHTTRSENLDGQIYYAYHADTPGENTYCFKGGPLPYLWYMDKGGYSGWSEMANSPELQSESAAYPLEDATKAIAKIYAQMRDQNLSNQAQPEGCEDIGPLEGFVFYPLQVNDDSVMELTKHSQSDVIDALSIQAAATGRPLVIKRHPLCTSPTIDAALTAAAEREGVTITTGSVNALIERAHSVVVTNSSVGFQALIARKPVYSLGHSEYAHMTTRIRSLKQLHKPYAAEQPARSEPATRQLGYMLDRYFVDVRDPARVSARLNEHIAAYTPSAKIAEQDSATEAANIYLTTAHTLNRQVREQVDFLLTLYMHSDEDAREQMARSLMKLARAGHHMPRIIGATDGAVSARVMRHHIKAGDWAATQAVAAALLDGAPDEVPEGADAALRTLLESAQDARQTGWPLEIATQAAALKGASYGTLMSFVRMGLDDGSVGSEALYAALVRAHKMRPKNPVPAWLEARIAQRDGDLDDALIAIRAAIKLAPDDESYPALRDAILAQQAALKPKDLAGDKQSPDV